ncbi:MAG: DUF6290 family protein [Lactobacillaceae bacterium]|jgi:predicted DNA-binding protein|nr:DUF6290 family protein [Lactobacillaceae bacterium]
MTMATSVRFDDDMNDILNDYTKSHGISKSEYIKQVVSESLEDWVDIQEADEAYKAWRDGGFKTVSHADMWSRLGIDNE